MRPFLSGIFPPLLTPLSDWQTVDVAGLEQLIDRLLSGGVHGLFILGTCGEGPSLDHTLQREVIDRVTQQVAGQVPILVGVTDSSLKETIALSEYAAERGCCAAVLSTPFYFPLTQDDLRRYLNHLAELISLPVILYNMPSHTKVWFEQETLVEFIQHPRFVGLKDSSGNLEYFRQAVQLRTLRPDWTFLMGPEHLLLPSLKLGGNGGISGGAHLLPRLFVHLVEAAFAERWDEAEKLEQRLSELGTLYRCFPGATFLNSVKAALSVMGICQGAFAEPLHPVATEHLSLIREQIEKLGLGRDILL